MITVATNADGWDYVAEGDWFTVARAGRQRPAGRDPDQRRSRTLTGKLTVNAEKNGETVSQEVALVQRAERSVNLSAEGTANCYIARTGGVYKFDASVKGNGGGDGVSDYIRQLRTRPSRTAPSPNCSGNRATTATRPCRAKSSTARRSTGAAT